MGLDSPGRWSLRAVIYPKMTSNALDKIKAKETNLGVLHARTSVVREPYIMSVRICR